MLKVGGGKNNCKLLISRQPRVRPSDHLLTQKMRALECGRAHKFSACVTGEERKAKQGGGRGGGEGDGGVAGREEETEEEVEEQGG